MQSDTRQLTGAVMVVVGAVLMCVAHGHAQARTVRMPSPAGQRIFAILLPQSYDSSSARYPVVYLFHGGGQDHTAYMARAAFAPMARHHEFIVVMPAADRTYGAAGSLGQERYHQFVATELVDYVDSHYRTIPTRGGRAIAGLSMGGRIATMTALGRPDRFGVAGAFSAAFRPDAEAAVRNLSDAAPYLYLSCGTADTLLPINREFVGWLVERNVPHEYHEAPGLGHTWTLWDREVAAFFDVLAMRGFGRQD